MPSAEPDQPPTPKKVDFPDPFDETESDYAYRVRLREWYDSIPLEPGQPAFRPGEWDYITSLVGIAPTEKANDQPPSRTAGGVVVINDEPPLVLADFNGLLTTRHLILETLGVHWDLERLGLNIHEGMRLRAFDDDIDDKGQRDNLIAEGIVERWPKSRSGVHWVLLIDYFCHESDIRDTPDHWVNHIDWDREADARRQWRRAHGIETNAHGGRKAFDG